MEVLETSMQVESIDTQEILAENLQNSSMPENENVKIETFVSLNECCVSCLAEGSAEELKLRSDRQMIQIYKEFVNRHVRNWVNEIFYKILFVIDKFLFGQIESKIKEIPIAFCDVSFLLLW